MGLSIGCGVEAIIGKAEAFQRCVGGHPPLAAGADLFKAKVELVARVDEKVPPVVGRGERPHGCPSVLPPLTDQLLLEGQQRPCPAEVRDFLPGDLVQAGERYDGGRVADAQSDGKVVRGDRGNVGASWIEAETPQVVLDGGERHQQVRCAGVPQMAVVGSASDLQGPLIQAVP
jgi:hypothetical protein